ncbi:hypothetical protein C2845_PM02G06970 [Panicum miliaceum]|uniref:Major facilitator superfamily (MFS) profile domain-containing protein n=1 Tax=Panicum miliaceum TaxID=4540 RepID=A0A3L6S420_PANMI|nr:hypothetical protein C2845_PM02G06970 [Panicum miliaceum]
METYTTDDALTVMGFGKFQALVLAYAGMGWVAVAMEVMLLSFLGPVVREEWNVSPQDESILSSVVFAGMLIGAFTWGFISDRYGRRKLVHFPINSNVLDIITYVQINQCNFDNGGGTGIGFPYVTSDWDQFAESTNQ